MPFFSPGANDTITLDVPPELKYLFRQIADDLSASLSDPELPGASRLRAPIDPALSEDDVVARLDREMSTEADIATFLATLNAGEIDFTTANAWLRVLALAAALRASALGVVTADDRAAVDDYHQMYLGMLSAFQFELIVALDPSLNPEIHPELYEGMLEFDDSDEE